MSLHHSLSLRSLLISEVPITVNLLIRFCQSVPQKQATSRQQLQAATVLYCRRLLFKLQHKPETGVIVQQSPNLLIIQPLYWTKRSHVRLKIEVGT